jgi:hypothetical protein
MFVELKSEDGRITVLNVEQVLYCDRYDDCWKVTMRDGAYANITHLEFDTNLKPVLSQCCSLYSRVEIEEKPKSPVLKRSVLGKEIKAAYSTKFGGPNPACDEEVDEAIRGYVLSGDGPTKRTYRERIKRLCSMMEVRFDEAKI